MPRILSAPPAAQEIYLLGSGAWRVVDVVPAEDNLEAPRVHWSPPASGTRKKRRASAYGLTPEEIKIVDDATK